MKSSSRGAALFQVAAAALLFCLRIQGADPSTLRGELPLRIEDALIAQTTGFRVLTSSRYDRTDEDRWRVNPQVEVSMPRHWQIDISSRLTDDDDRAGSRLVRLSVAHQFVVERNWIPNIAFSFAADVPRGDKSKGIDTRLKTSTRHQDPQYLVIGRGAS